MKQCSRSIRRNIEPFFFFFFNGDVESGWLTRVNSWFLVHPAYRDIEEGRDTFQLSSQNDL